MDSLEAVAIVVASTILFIQNRLQSFKLKKVNATLTENNGGSSVPDRLEKMQRELGEKIDAVDHRVVTVNGRVDGIDRRLSEHLDDADVIVGTLKRKGLIDHRDYDDS